MSTHLEEYGRFIREELRQSAEADELAQKMAILTARIAALVEQVSHLTERVGKLEDAAWERKVSVNIVNFAHFRLGLSQVRILKSAVMHTRDELQTLLLSAVDRKRLTDHEALQIGFSDIVLSAKRRDSARAVYAVVEASRNMADNVVVRAERCAQALARASGTEVLPVIIGARISEKQRALAENRNVICLDISDE